MFDEKKFYFDTEENELALIANRVSTPDLEEFIHIESKKITDFKCGSCDGEMKLHIYYRTSPRKILRNYKCENCGIETWR